MKRILIAILVLSMCLLLPSCGEKITFNAAEDLPEGAETLVITKAGKSGGAYYVTAQAEGRNYTFKLAEDFTAQAFEPGVDGALYKTDYNSPQDFYTQWYQQVVKQDALGTVFSFIFVDDELYSLTDTSEPSPPDGPPMDGVPLPEGVEYVEEFKLLSDPGDNMSAGDGAAALFSAIVFLHDDFYTPGDIVTITLTGLDAIDGADAYLYTVTTPAGESKHAVNYWGDVFVLQGEEYMLIYQGAEGRGDLIPLDADQAMYIVSELLKAQLGEGMALVAKGGGEVNGGPAFLIDLGTNTDEKFTAEGHYAVTDDGEVWLLDVLTGQWQPAAAG